MTVQNTRVVLERYNGKIENFHFISVWRELVSVSILFNIFIEIKIRQKDTRGNISTKPTQLFAYAYDLAIVSGKWNKLVENFLILEKDSRNAGIVIKHSKISYMKTSTR